MYTSFRKVSIEIKPQFKGLFNYHLLEILKHLAVPGETDFTALIIKQKPDP